MRGGIIFSHQIGTVHAVSGLNFEIQKGETFGLVGESGCGKTTTAKMIAGLIPPTSGNILFEGENVWKILETKKREKIIDFRKKVQTIFQNPYTCLNPQKTVYQTVVEPLKIHKIVSKEDLMERVYELLKQVSLSEYLMNRYPSELSGGERQRVGLARALAVEPKFLICDEPVSSLDVSIRIQILKLFMEIKTQLNLTYLFISHDIVSVKYLADHLGIMYLGKIVEIGEKNKIFDRPLHPYNKALMSAIPIPDPRHERSGIIIEGEVPSPINPPSGCRFRTRCPYVRSICKEKEPTLREIENLHYVACHMI